MEAYVAPAQTEGQSLSVISTDFILNIFAL